MKLSLNFRSLQIGPTRELRNAPHTVMISKQNPSDPNPSRLPDPSPTALTNPAALGLPVTRTHALHLYQQIRTSRLC